MAEIVADRICTKQAPRLLCLPQIAPRTHGTGNKVGSAWGEEGVAATKPIELPLNLVGIELDTTVSKADILCV
jgi:hypothetical protein